MPPVERPTSPHLSIYKPQITSVMSILHRATGVALYAGALLLVAWLVVATYMPNSYAGFHAALASKLGLTFLFGWTLAFYYHLCNGIRHLFWDMGRGFALKNVTLSGVATLIATLLLTIGSWAYAYHSTGML